MSSLENIGSILDSFLSNRGYKKYCKESEIITKWPEIVGEEVSAVSSCQRVEEGILYVKITSSSWRNEMHFFKNEILNKVNKEYKCKSIKDIVFI